MTQPTRVRRVRGHRPHLLDLYCCQGGAAKGYADAGFAAQFLAVEGRAAA